MSRQHSSKSQKQQGQGLIRSGLSVQELKAITAVRVNVATELGDKSINVKAPQTGIRSYQTANATQMLAAGMVLSSAPNSPRVDPVSPRGISQTSQYSQYESNNQYHHYQEKNVKPPFYPGHEDLNDEYHMYNLAQYRTSSSRVPSSSSNSSSNLSSPHLTPRGSSSTDIVPSLTSAIAHASIADKLTRIDQFQREHSQYNSPRQENRPSTISRQVPELSFNTSIVNYNQAPSPRDGYITSMQLSQSTIQEESAYRRNPEKYDSFASPRDKSDSLNGHSMSPYQGYSDQDRNYLYPEGSPYHMSSRVPDSSKALTSPRVPTLIYPQSGSDRNSGALGSSMLNSFSPNRRDTNVSLLQNDESTFLPSLTPPRPTYNHPSTKKTPLGIGLDFSTLNGNQYHLDSSDGQNMSGRDNRLNMSTGGSLSTRIELDYPPRPYPYTPDKISTSAGLLAVTSNRELGLRTSSDSDLLAVEIAESILNASASTPDSEASRRTMFGESDSRSIGFDNLSPSRYYKEQKLGSPYLSTPSKSPFQLPLPEPQKQSPRLVDGWLSGRLEEPSSSYSDVRLYSTSPDSRKPRDIYNSDGYNRYGEDVVYANANTLRSSQDQLSNVSSGIALPGGYDNRYYH